MPPPLMVPNSFVFAHIFTEKHPCWRSTPPLNESTTPYRKSWIHPCAYSIIVGVNFKNKGQLIKKKIKYTKTTSRKQYINNQLVVRQSRFFLFENYGLIWQLSNEKLCQMEIFMNHGKILCNILVI